MIFKNKDNVLFKTMFFGNKYLDIFYCNKVKYLIFENLIQKQMSVFWGPEKVDLFKDKIDFKFLSDNEKYVLICILKYQILLNYIQIKNTNIALLPLVSIFELENWIQTWIFFKIIHYNSYNYIVNSFLSIYNFVINDSIYNRYITDKIKYITKFYNDLIIINNYLNFGNNNFYNKKFLDEIKKKLYLCLISINALESVCCCVSYLFFVSFSKNKNMEGILKIINLIFRDKNLHLIGINNIINILKLVKEENMYSIVKECKEESFNIFVNIVNQEKNWVKYLFTNGSIINLKKKIVLKYIEYIANLFMKAIYLKIPFNVYDNPIPWVDNWFSFSKERFYSFELEIYSYLIDD